LTTKATGPAPADATTVDVLGDYAREENVRQLWITPLTVECGLCGMPVPAGTVCVDEVCLKTRTSGRYVTRDWQVAA
jgi:hypothetical protein